MFTPVQHDCWPLTLTSVDRWLWPLTFSLTCVDFSVDFFQSWLFATQVLPTQFFVLISFLWSIFAVEVLLWLKMKFLSLFTGDKIRRFLILFVPFASIAVTLLIYVTCVPAFFSALQPWLPLSLYHHPMLYLLILSHWLHLLTA